MVPGWSERERLSLHAMRQVWIHAYWRDRPAPGIRAGLRRLRRLRTSLAVRGRQVIWWSGRYMLLVASLPGQIWALRTFSLFDQLSRGGTQ